MIICPKCRFNNPPRQMFCTSCGTRLDTDRAVVTETLRREVEVEKQQATATEVQQFMMAAIFFLLITLLFKYMVADNPPAPQAMPLMQSPMHNLNEKSQGEIAPVPVLPLPQH